jgi:hypothetical protein
MAVLHLDNSQSEASAGLFPDHGNVSRPPAHRGFAESLAQQVHRARKRQGRSTALYTVIFNLVVAIVLTPVLNAMQPRRTAFDATVAADYHA